MSRPRFHRAFSGPAARGMWLSADRRVMARRMHQRCWMLLATPRFQTSRRNITTRRLLDASGLTLAEFPTRDAALIAWEAAAALEGPDE